MMHNIQPYYKAYRAKIKVHKGKIFIVDVMNVVCKHFNIDKETLLKRSRKREIVWSRHLFHYFAVKYCKKSHERVGFFSGRDRTTVIHSLETVSNLSQTNAECRSDFMQINAHLYKMGNAYNN